MSARLQSTPESTSLVKDYSVRLAQLGADSDQHVHATRLKNNLTTHIPELQAISNGRCCIVLLRNGR